VVGSLPAFFARPLALRQLRLLARRYFGGTVRRDGAAVVLEVPTPLTGDAAPGGAGCAYYEAGFAELLRRLTGAGDGPAAGALAVEHAHRAPSRRGGHACAWRAEWRA
jgi:hypothetical protein